MTYVEEQVWAPFSESLVSWDDAFHHLMLQDRLRMEAYRKAIFEVVQPGDHVIDLGAGTGILSQWALEAGAARVTGIEMNAEILALAVSRLKEAGHDERFAPVNQLSYDFEPNAPADVLISEIIGNMADNEDFQPILEDAIRRFLKPGGRVLPLAVSSYLVPVAATKSHKDLCAGKVASLSPHYDVEELYRQRGVRSPFDIYYDCIVPFDRYLAEPQQVCRYSGKWDQAPTYAHQRSYVLHSSGRFTGLKGYFVAELSPQTILDISGGDVSAGETSDSWKHAYLPIKTPIEVQRGDILKLTFSRSYPANHEIEFRQIYDWRGVVERQGNVIGEFSQRLGG